MAKVIRVGIIGLGRSGNDIHAKHLSSDPSRYKIMAVADALPDRLEKAAQAYGCDTYTEWHELLKRDDIDLIVNASPTKFHIDWSIECLEAGFNVISEKPLTPQASEVDRAMEAVAKSGKVMTVFQNYRYGPVFDQIREVIDSGVLGRLVMIKGVACGFKRRWDWQTTRENFGGDLLNTGSHNLDQILQLLEEGVAPQVTCQMDRVLTYGDAEDHIKILLTTPGHPSVDLEISSCCAYPSGAGEFLNIYGTRGGLRVGWEKAEWRYLDPKKQPKRELNTGALSDAKGNPAYCGDALVWEDKIINFEKGVFDLSISGYYDALHTSLVEGKEPEVTLKQIRQQAVIIEECLRQNPIESLPQADIFE